MTQVALTPEQARFIEERIASGKYHSAGEVVEDGLRLLEAQEHERQARLDRMRGMIQEGAALMAATKTKKKTPNGPPAKTYTELVSELPPRPLHDRADYDAAVEMMGRLIGFDLNEDQEDYLNALGMFVDAYEAAHVATQVDTNRITGLDILRSLVEDHGMSGAELSRVLDATRTLGPMILRGERAITAEHAKKLGAYFKMNPGVFIR